MAVLNIDAAARALMARVTGGRLDWDRMTEGHRDMYREDVQAVLKAVKEPVCTCTELAQLTVCHDTRVEPHLVGCPRWGTPAHQGAEVDDPRGGWSFCPDCGRVARTTRYGVRGEHTVDPDMDDPCPGSGRRV